MKQALKSILSKSASAQTLHSLIKRSGRGLIMPFYHVVSDCEAIHLKHLYPVISTKRFEQDLDFLLQNYKPVGHQYLNGIDIAGKTEKAFFLSFDDGLSEFYSIAAPILLRKGIPCTCFINSAFVDNKCMFYRMKASLLIERCITKPLSEGERQKIEFLFQEKGRPYRQASDFLKITYQQQDLLDTAGEVLDVNFSGYQDIHKPYLSTAQINELIGQGFTFGAHSVDHPFYYDLDEQQQVDETLDCLAFLKDNFQIQERLFSFPFSDYGVKSSFFERIKAEIDFSFGTANLKQDSIPTNFQRIPMEIAGKNSADQIIKAEYLFFILKKIFGKQIIMRD